MRFKECRALGPKKPGESGKTANGPKIKKKLSQCQQMRL